MPSYFYDKISVVFVRVPKTGSTSIERAFLPEMPPPIYRFSGPPPEYLHGMKSFAFVRHPVARFASAMAMFNPEFDMMLNVNYVLGLLDDDRIPCGTDTKLQRLKLHTLPMSHAHFGLGSIKRIFRFEHFDSEWQRLAAYLEVPAPPIVHLNASDRNIDKPSFAEYEVRAIQNYFQADFQMFGYKL